MSDIKSFQNTTYINGPINLHRLEGEIEGKKKVLYIFSDVHVYETKCDEKFSLDIGQFFIKEFNKINSNNENIEYDFFLETFPHSIYTDSKLKGKNYLDDLRFVFQKHVKFNDNKMTISDFGEKVRLHYIDVRNNIMFNIIFDLFPSLRNFYTNNNINNVLQYSEIIINELSFLLDLFNNYTTDDKTNLISVLKNPDLQDSKNKEADKYLKKIIYKIFNLYNYKNVKIQLAKYIDNSLEKINLAKKKLQDFHNKILDIYNKINNNYNKIYCDEKNCYYINHSSFTDKYNLLSPYLDDIDNNISNAFVLIMDVYFLRRFLDKDYVTNGIVYNGYSHTYNIIYILVNNFNFKITHSLLNKDLNKYVKNKDYENFVSKDWINIFPDQLMQCSNIANFPKLFK